MQLIPIFKFERENGGTTVSPIKPECKHTEMLRIIADAGKLLTKDGKSFTACTDTDTADGWYEVAESNAENGGDIHVG